LYILEFRTPKNKYIKALTSLINRNIELSTNNIFELPLKDKGMWAKGIFVNTTQKIFKVNTLGTYCDSLDIDCITIEVPWKIKPTRRSTLQAQAIIAILENINS